jgi:hypothetical protein
VVEKDIEMTQKKMFQAGIGTLEGGSTLEDEEKTGT